MNGVSGSVLTSGALMSSTGAGLSISSALTSNGEFISLCVLVAQLSEFCSEFVVSGFRNEGFRQFAVPTACHFPEPRIFKADKFLQASQKHRMAKCSDPYRVEDFLAVSGVIVGDIGDI